MCAHTVGPDWGLSPWAPPSSLPICLDLPGIEVALPSPFPRLKALLQLFLAGGHWCLGLRAVKEPSLGVRCWSPKPLVALVGQVIHDTPSSGHFEVSAGLGSHIPLLPSLMLSQPGDTFTTTPP